MKAFCISFARFIREIFKDAMLAAMTILPLLLALLFRFGIPPLENLMEAKTQISRVLSPYYILFDLTVIFSTPVMFGYAGLMVILEERDSGIMKYLCVTPLRIKGYILSRLVCLSAIAAAYGFATESIFHISRISPMQIFLGSFFSFLAGIWTVCLITLLATNKVEGLAFSKFSGLLILGPLASFFIKDPVKYITAFLPTFWFTEYSLNPGAYGTASLLAAFALSAAYLVPILCRTSRMSERL